MWEEETVADFTDCVKAWNDNLQFSSARNDGKAVEAEAKARVNSEHTYAYMNACLFTIYFHSRMVYWGVERVDRRISM